MITKNNLIFGSLLAIGMTTTVLIESSPAILTILPTCNEKQTGDYNIHCGPGKGLEKPVEQTNKINLKSIADLKIIKIPHDGNPLFQIHEQKDFRVKKATTAWANGFVDLNSTSSVNFKIGDTVDLSTVWSQKLTVIPTQLLALSPSPPIPAGLLTGFDPSDPEMVPLDDGFFISCCGTLYPATFSITTTLAALPTILPGHDLSAYDILGSPNSIVYVSRLTISSSDFICVPEPSTLLSLLTLGLLGSGLIYKRKRQNSL